LLIGAPGFRLPQIDGQSAERLQGLGDTGRHALALFARKRRRVLHDAEILLAVHELALGDRAHAGNRRDHGQILDARTRRSVGACVQGAAIQPKPAAVAAIVVANAAAPLSITSVTVSRASDADRVIDRPASASSTLRPHRAGRRGRRDDTDSSHARHPARSSGRPAADCGALVCCARVGQVGCAYSSWWCRTRALGD
jgi:hypothetical protein